jgi:4-hydroxybenzoate polyprenyltransferase
MTMAAHLISVRDLLRLTRFWNLLILGAAQMCAAVFLLGVSPMDLRLGALIVSTLCVAAGGYIINDYYDIKIDYVNKPHRVVVGKSVSRRVALLIHSAVSFAGVALGFLVGWKIALINILCVFLLWLYSNLLKRLPFIGNLMVAALTWAAIIVTGIAFPSSRLLVTAYAGFAFFLSLAREIIKDMEDWKGDKTYGCRTLPIVFGLRQTKWIVMATVAVYVLFLSVMMAAYDALSTTYLLLLALLPSVILVERLWKADTVADYARLSLICKVLLVLGIGSMPFTG